ncbi:MAG: putative toxin-antitoxin system toxin component, PIN family [Fibromonadaceae bacterium]|jgi:putative PIN family toxin of toxin-antitoxin system|nr:putative toxin-antitoxin system toxin component, PIN family [Fibromonadaceae bacterium]
MLKIVIDANLWVSFLIGKRLKNLDELCFDEKVVVISSPKIIEEFIDVSSRESLRKYVNHEKIPEVLKILETRCANDPIEYSVNSSLRDPDDLYLLALSAEVGANFLLTGDKDLLTLGRYEQTEIITFSNFMSLHYGQQESQP